MPPRAARPVSTLTPPKPSVLARRSPRLRSASGGPRKLPLSRSIHGNLSTNAVKNVPPDASSAWLA